MSKAKRDPVAQSGAKVTTKPMLTRGQLSVLQFAAEQKFVFFDEAVSYDDIAAMPEFAGVTAVSIRNWALAGDWAAKRRAYLGRLRQKVENKIAEQVVQQMRADLRLYDQLHSQFAEYILPDPQTGRLRAEPKSPESAVTALLKIGEARARVRDELARTVGAGISGPGQASAAPAPAPDELTPEQAQRMAHVLLQAQIAQASPAPDGPASAKKAKQST